MKHNEEIDKKKFNNGDKLNEDNLNKYSPEEFIDNVNRESKSLPFHEEERKGKKTSDEELEKFKQGELGAKHFRYNDDGSGGGSSHKVNIDPDDISK